MGEPHHFRRWEEEPICVFMKSDQPMGEPHHFRRGEGEPSCVSVKSNQSMGEPCHFRIGEEERSCVSMKSDQSMGEPRHFRRGEDEHSCVSMKSDQSMGEPRHFRRAEEERSCVSMKSDQSMGEPLYFRNGKGEPSCVSIKSDQSIREPRHFSSEVGELSCVSMKSDQSMGEPLYFRNWKGEPSCVSMKSNQSMGEPRHFRRGEGEPSCVSMKSDQSMGEPLYFRNWKGEPSCVSMKSNQSMGEPRHFRRGEGEPSCVSMKSNQSMGEPCHFRIGEEERSCVSMKSDQSMGEPRHFRREEGEPSCVSMKSDQSMGEPRHFRRGEGEPSCVSVKNDQSMGEAHHFRRGEEEPSCVSMKSDQSMGEPRHFRRGEGEPSCVSVKNDQSMGEAHHFRRGEEEPSCVSVKNDQLIPLAPDFSRGPEPSDPHLRRDGHLQVQSRCGVGNHLLADPVSISCRHSFCRQCIISYWDHLAPSEDFICPQCRKKCRTHPVLHSHKVAMEQDSYQPAHDVLHSVLERHKTRLQKKYECLFEAIKTPENKTILNRIYTQLYIIEGESEGVNEEHEFLRMEKTHRKHFQDTPINCSDIFKPRECLKGEEDQETITAETAEDLSHKVLTEKTEDEESKEPELRAVLTKGIAGIGKTVSVQKFILDWAEGKANQDVDFMFVLPFRELNLIKDDQYSLHGLLCAFHPELKDLDPEIYDKIKAVFIFDGLDESRIPLSFSHCSKVCDITMTSSVGVLMTNLIKGELLPSALIWITSRPAAASQIPRELVNRVTEIQGFSDPQKKEYFKKRISNEEQAEKIISHIKAVRSLHIMCHIPVFCWISATVLQQIMEHNDTKIPKTLTEMYSHFLLTQTHMKNEKYEEKKRDLKNLLESNRTILLKLAELAFKQLMKGNVMFYEEDLRESSIDVTQASVYSGIFTEIFREECVFHQRKVYCFVHLSFQEFLAALYVFHCYESNNMKELKVFNPLNRKRPADFPLQFSGQPVRVPLLKCEPHYPSWPVKIFNPPNRQWSDNVKLEELLTGAVDKALSCQNGSLDLFLRFLMGISLESNQKLLQGLLTQKQSSSEKTREYMKKLIKGDNHTDNAVSTDKSITLFLCLSEMKDQSLSREIDEYLKSEKYSEKKLTSGQCSALACMLLVSEEVLDELDLKKYNTSERGYMRLIPAMSVCTKALLAGCNITISSCKALCSALQSTNSSLKELDLSNNYLHDSGVELLSAGLQSSHCKLEILRLAICNFTEKACKNLASALQSANSFLKELDLSNNDLLDSGVEHLSAGLKNSHCKLEILRLSGCMVTNAGCSSLASALKSDTSHLRELDLTYNYPGVSGVKLLSDLLEDPHCTLEKFRVDERKIQMKKGLIKYAVVLTMDPNTVNRCLRLCEWQQNVVHVGEDQRYSYHPDRFDVYPQVLCKESLTGRCYWEVEWGGHGAVIAVSYSGISRKGGSEDCGFGSNNQSWCLECFNESFSAWHNNVETVISAPPSCSRRAAVYLDCEAGILSFYSLPPKKHTPSRIHICHLEFNQPYTHTLSHLHTFYSTFTEPLYAGFRVYSDSKVCVRC